MQSISSFANRNGFDKGKIETLVVELEINLINAGPVKMLHNEDAKTLRKVYFERYMKTT